MGRRLDGGIAAAGRLRRRIQDVDVEFCDVFQHRGVHMAQEIVGRRASSRQYQCPLFTRFNQSVSKSLMAIFLRKA